MMNIIIILGDLYDPNKEFDSTSERKYRKQKPTIMQQNNKRN